jgi:hypothetical protein
MERGSIVFSGIYGETGISYQMPLKVLIKNGIMDDYPGF